MRNIKLNWRYYFILLLITNVFGLLAYKLVHMQTVEYNKLKKEGDNRSERTLTITAYRGMISDRNGKPLAISTPVNSIWVNPFYIKSDNLQLRKILNILDLDKAQQEAIITRIKARKERHGFVYLKRQVSPFIAQKVKTLDIKGIEVEREFKCFYPDAEVMAHVVGFTNIDDQGQEGIELEYNRYLTGTDGTRLIHKDLKGGVARKNDTDKKVKHGTDISLSIDRKLQYIAYKYIKEGVINNHAEAGSAVVINVKTGEILAMVNYPSYNPNNMQDAAPNKRRNRVLTDVYESGSMIKPFAAIAGMQSGQYDVDTIVDTSPGFYRLNGRTVRDFRNYGEMDLRHILMKSSNVGISRIILSIDANALGDTLRKFGFGKITKIGFPGERSGYVPSPRKWGDFPLATLSFGYGMNATALQVATAYSAIANRGKLIAPTLLKRNKKEDIEAHQVINAEIAEKVVDMLTSVVEGSGGTASKARVPRYHVAGKTGTVRKAIAGGYALDSYMATFVGIAPSSNPQIVTVVVIDDPKGEAYGGGSAAAPIFAQITEHILGAMCVPADKLEKLND